jgi:hypothetical protein
MRDDNVFHEGRLIARHCVSQERRDILRARIDECKAVYDVFALSPTRSGMLDLIAHWTRMLRAMDAVGPIGEPDPPSGRLPKPKAADPTRAVA